MKKIFAYFRRLQWKLTVSYAFVTISTVIVLAALLVGIAVVAENMTSARTSDIFFWSKTSFQDNIPHLLDNPKVLQTWLERVQKDGFKKSDFQSYTVNETLAFANMLVKDMPIYVLDPELNLLAATPPAESSLIGKPFEPRKVNGINMESILSAAQVGDKNYIAQSQPLQDGNYLVAFPLRKTDADPVSAIVVYYIKPVTTFATPANFEIYRTFFLITTIIMLVVALPVGAVFGWLASRGLRKRLASLSVASQAWSKGDFSATPRDKSGDEIGELTRNLSGMAEQLQTLLQTRNELTRVEERNRLARDLHDTVKQQTYASRMQLTAAKNLLKSKDKQALEHIESALQLNRETQQELKLIIDELRPAALKGKGLVQALTEYAERWQEHTGIHTTTSISGDRPLPLDLEQVLYRVLQESLSNVARHAEADSVTLNLSLTPEQATLSITDNGRGFDPNAVSSSSYGLTGMKGRIDEVGGNLTVESVITEGTKIIVSVPLNEKEG